MNDTKAVDERKYAPFTLAFNDPWEDKDISLEFPFAKPTKTQIKRLSDKAGRNPAQAGRDLLLGCIHPDRREEFIAAMEKYPGAVTSYSGALVKGVGITADLGN